MTAKKIILDLQFEEYDPTATVTDSSTDGDETEELIIAAGEPGIGGKIQGFSRKIMIFTLTGMEI